MSGFTQYQPFMNSLRDPTLDTSQLIIRTCGKGRKKGYHKPTKLKRAQAVQLTQLLQAFDAAPSQTTWSTLQTHLATMEMVMQRVVDNPEWLYITSKGDPRSRAWEARSRNNQFNLSWHVGSDSKIGAIDEHNGKDGAFNAAEEMAEKANLKYILHNARHPMATTAGSKQQRGRYMSDWAHSADTIAPAIIRGLKDTIPRMVLIQIHGMKNGKRSRALMVNNFNNRFMHQDSWPTLFAIALAKRFPDRFFTFGTNEIPGSIVRNGVKRQLMTKSNRNAHLMRTKKMPHNNNWTGRYVMNRGRDTGETCHIEFTKWLRNGGSDLVKFVAAMQEANYWYENYDDATHNVWMLRERYPEIYEDMSRYSELFPPPSTELAIAFAATEASSARMAHWSERNLEAMAEPDLYEEDSEYEESDIEGEMSSDHEISDMEDDPDLIAEESDDDEPDTVAAASADVAGSNVVLFSGSPTVGGRGSKKRTRDSSSARTAPSSDSKRRRRANP